MMENGSDGWEGGDCHTLAKRSHLPRLSSDARKMKVTYNSPFSSHDGKWSQKYSISFTEADTMLHEMDQCIKFKKQTTEELKERHMHMYILKVGRTFYE